MMKSFNIFSDKCPLTKKIDSIDETIKELNDRIRILELQLKVTDGKEDNDIRKAIKLELLEMKKLIATHEHGLKHLRAQNRKTFMFIAMFVFACFLLYCTYILVVGYD